MIELSLLGLVAALAALFFRLQYPDYYRRGLHLDMWNAKVAHQQATLKRLGDKAREEEARLAELKRMKQKVSDDIERARVDTMLILSNRTPVLTREILPESLEGCQYFEGTVARRGTEFKRGGMWDWKNVLMVYATDRLHAKALVDNRYDYTAGFVVTLPETGEPIESMKIDFGGLGDLS